STGTEADNGAMSALAEPISPELALVCPELRERALAALADPTWETLLAQAQARARAEHLPANASVRARLGWGVAYLYGLLWPIALATLVAVLATGMLTVVADATR